MSSELLGSSYSPEIYYQSSQHELFRSVCADFETTDAAKYTRNGQTLPEGKFIISQQLKGQNTEALGTPINIDDVSFHLDGQLGFCFGFQQDYLPPIWFAIASFSFPENCSDPTLFAHNAPVIVQLQGAKDRQVTKEKERQAARIQNSFNFEQAQIAVIAAFAAASSYPTVYMLPLSQNPYYGFHPDRDNRLRRRYIDSGVQAGFIPDTNNVLSLSLS